MGTLFLLDLAYAAGIAISPTPVVVVILMLFSEKGRGNAIGFLAGWIVGLTLLGAVLYALVDASAAALESTSAFARPSIQILLGVGVLILAWRRWNKQPKESVEASMPGWFKSLDKLLTESSDKFTPRRAIVLAFVMSALSPKNIALMLALIFAISDENLAIQDAAVLLVVFILISSVSIGLPILYAMVKGEKAPEALDQWKTWVILNRGRALALLLFVLGGIIVMNGVIGLIEKGALG